MSNVERVQITLNEYGNALGLGDLPLDEEYSAVLEFDDIPFEFRLDPDNELVWVFIELGGIDSGNVEALTFVLEIGLMAWVKDVFTLSLDPDNRVVAHTCTPAFRLNLPGLEAFLARIFQVAKPLAADIRNAHFRNAFLVQDRDQDSEAGQLTNEFLV